VVNYICMFVCMYVCIYAYICVCKIIVMYVYICIYTHKYNFVLYRCDACSLTLREERRLKMSENRVLR